MRLTSLLLVAALLSACAPRRYQVPASVPAVAGAQAWVEVTPRGDEGAHIVLQVRELPPIHKFAPEMRAYIVWALAPGNPPRNLGTLRVDDTGTGIFVHQAAMRFFDLVVTAEQDVAAAQPAGQEVLRARLDY